MQTFRGWKVDSPIVFSLVLSMGLLPSQPLTLSNLAGVSVNGLLDTGSFLCRGDFDKIYLKLPLALCDSNCIGITG